MKRIILTLLLAAAYAYCDSANIRMAKMIWVPDGWSEPTIVTASSSSRTSYTPSTPTGWQRREVGASIGLIRSSIHRNPNAKIQRKYTLSIKGIRRKVKVGQTVRVKKRSYKVLGEKDGKFWLEDRKTGRLWRFRQGKPDDKKSGEKDSKKR